MILEKFYGILNLHVKKNKSCRLLIMKQISSQTKNLWGGGVKEKCIRTEETEKGTAAVLF